MQPVQYEHTPLGAATDATINRRSADVQSLEVRLMVGPGQPNAPATFVAPLISPAGRRLYEAAVTLFHERGSRSTSVRDIASLCGLTQGALYNHFLSKDQLLFRIVHDTHRALETEVLAALTESDDPKAQLAAIVGVYVLFHAAHPHEAHVANAEFRNLAAERTTQIVAIRRRLRGYLVEVLRTGEAGGSFRLPAGDLVAARLTAATILQMCIQMTEWFHHDRNWSAQRFARYAVEVALRIAGA